MPLFIRIAVMLAIALPYWVARRPRDFSEIFLVALIACAAGQLAEWLVKVTGKPSDEAEPKP